MVIRKEDQLRIRWIWKSSTDTAKGVRFARPPDHLIRRRSSHFIVATAIRLKQVERSDLTIAENLW